MAKALVGVAAALAMLWGGTATAQQRLNDRRYDEQGNRIGEQASRPQAPSEADQARIERLRGSLDLRSQDLTRRLTKYIADRKAADSEFNAIKARLDVWTKDQTAVDAAVQLGRRLGGVGDGTLRKQESQAQKLRQIKSDYSAYLRKSNALTNEIKEITRDQDSVRKERERLSAEASTRQTSTRR